MTGDHWRQFLQEFSNELLLPHDIKIEVPEEARKARWMGYESATPAAIEAAETRLGRRLPPSLRAFYAVTNGWRATGFYINDILPVEKIDWLANREPHLYQLAVKDETPSRPFRNDPDGTRQREYILEQGTRVKRSLAVSSWGDAAILLIDPGAAPHDEEWPAGRWASWSPGMSWQASNFGELMKREFASLKPE